MQPNRPATLRSRLKIRIARNVPPVAYSAFFWTSAGSLGVMLMATSQNEDVFLTAMEGGLIDGLTLIIDPVIFHIIGVYCVANLIRSYFRRVDYPKDGDGSATPKVRATQLAISYLIPIVSLLAALVLEVFVLKPSFNYERPTPIMSPPLVTGLLESLLERIWPEAIYSTPSGYGFRQMILLLLGLTYFSRFFENPNRRVSPKLIQSEVYFVACLVICMLAVCFLRMLRGTHTLFDIGIAVGAGAYYFWLVFYLITCASGLVHRHATGGVSAITFIFFPVFMFHSQDAHLWVLNAIVIIFLVGTVHLFSDQEEHDDSSGVKIWWMDDE